MFLTLLTVLLSAAPASTPGVRSMNALGHIDVQSGVLSSPLGADLSTSALAWVSTQRQNLGLPVTSRLVPSDVLRTRLGASIHFQQQVGGFDIYGAKVTLTVDPARRVRVLNSDVIAYRRALLDWAVSPEEAMARAARDVSWPRLKDDGSPWGGYRRMLFQVGEEVHAGYLVFVPTLQAAENWHLAVSAVTGDVLWKQNRVFHSRAADIYEHSPGGLDAGVGIAPLKRVELSHADGRSMVLADVSLPLPDGGVVNFSNEAGKLFGTQVISFGCCPAQDCSLEPDAGPRIVKGTTNMGGGNFNYEFAMCDRVQRVSKDVSGDYLFTPVDAPQGPVVQSSLSDSEPFAEVHTFYHVNKVYDWFRELSGSDGSLPVFSLRDEKRSPPRKLSTWSNVTFPDFNDIDFMEVLSTGVVKATKLARIDNAAFMPRENLEQMALPDLANGGDNDSLLLFQGTLSDFAYDAPVVWHEFGHAVIASTANFSAFSLDELSANNEGGALHEALADYFAVAYGNRSVVGEYVGPRLTVGNGGQLSQQITGLRDANNAYACPEVLWGEVHQDAMHVTGALWEARQTHFLGKDNGRTFDAAIFAALVAMTPRTNFESAAQIILEMMPLAFPDISDARERMQAIFLKRGVTRCSKVVDITADSLPRIFYAIPGRQDVGVNSGEVPGPYQFRVKAPRGLKSIRFSASAGGGGGGGQFGNQGPQVTLLVRKGGPVTFTRNGLALSNNAEVKVVATSGRSTIGATANLDVPCGEASEVYLTLGTAGASTQTLQDVEVSFEEATACASSPDASVVTLPPVELEATAENLVTGPAPAGCGCTSTDVGFGAFAWLALAGLRRRRARSS